VLTDCRYAQTTHVGDDRASGLSLAPARLWRAKFLERHGLQCLIVDIAASELEKAPAGYDTLVGDVSSPGFSTGEHDGRYDVVFSRALPESVAEWILLKIEPWRVKSGKSGRFPAFYDWCFGPTSSQIRRLATTGFAVEHCVAYVGESSHAPGRLMKKVDREWTELMLRHPNYHFTSYATYTLRAR
jgi:hypothetical protein